MEFPLVDLNEARNTKDRILLAAVRMFSENGYTAVSRKNIAKASNITKATIYEHYESKGALFNAIIETINRTYLDFYNRVDRKIENASCFADVLDCLFAELKEVYHLFIYYAGVEAEMRERLVSVPTNMPTGMPSTHNPRAMETRLAASLDEIDVLKARYRRALEYMEWFQPAWDALSEDERFVLTEFYGSEDMQTSAVDAIAKRYCIERSSAYRRKNRALALCKNCHSRITATEGGRWGK